MLSLHKLLGYWTKNSCESIATAKAFIICTATGIVQCTVSSIEMNVSKKYIEVYGSEADPNHNDKWKPDPNHNEKWKPDPNENCWSRHTDVYSTVLNIWMCTVVCFHMKYTWNISCCFSYPIYSYSTVYCVSISHIWFWVIFSGYYCSI